MAFVHGRTTEVYWNGSNYSSLFNSASLSATGETADTTAFGATWRSSIAGLLTATASFSGFYDGIALTWLGALGSDGGVLTYLPGGDTNIGDPARLLSVIETTVTISAPVADVVAVALDMQVQASVGFGQVLHPLSEDTNTTTGAEKDDASATATGWQAHLQVTAVDAGTWTIKLQDAAVSNTYSDVTNGAFSAVTTAGAERLVSATTTAALRRFVRYIATRSGGTAGDGITFSLTYARTGSI